MTKQHYRKDRDRSIGEIGVQVLRQFQNDHCSPTQPFKRVPDGFEIDFDRKALPAGEKNECEPKEQP